MIAHGSMVSRDGRGARTLARKGGDFGVDFDVLAYKLRVRDRRATQVQRKTLAGSE